MIRLYWITLRQLLRQPIFWVINVSIIVISEISPAFAEIFSFGRVEQAVMDTSRASVYMAVWLTALVCSYQLLSKEINEKVALSLFTTPLGPLGFLSSKAAALFTTLTLVFMVQGTMIFKHSWTYEWTSEGIFFLLFNLYTVLLQGLMLLSLSIMCSCVIHGIRSLYLAIVLMVAGSMVPEPWSLGLSWLCPLLGWFDLSYWMYHRVEIPFLLVFALTAYALAYSCWMIWVGSQWLSRRDY